jgi:chromosome segregation ATPase
VKSSHKLLLLSVVLLGISPQNIIWGATRVQQEQQQVNQAQKKARQTSQALEQARQALTQAETAQEKAAEKLKQAGAEASRQQSEKLGLPSILAERDAARTAVTQRQEAILRSLKTQAVYQDKIKAAESANERLRQLADDRSMSDDQRHKLMSELTVVTKGPMEMQKREFAADPKLKEASQRLQNADQKAARIQKELAKAVEADPEVRKARSEVKKAGEELEKARQALKEAEKEHNIAQSNLQRENQQLNQAERNRALDNRQPRRRR